MEKKTLAETVRNDYLTLCKETGTDPVEFEDGCCGAVDATMFDDSVEAQAVWQTIQDLRARREVNPPAEYWNWLASQIERLAD